MLVQRQLEEDERGQGSDGNNSVESGERDCGPRGKSNNRSRLPSPGEAFTALLGGEDALNPLTYEELAAREQAEVEAAQKEERRREREERESEHEHLWSREEQRGGQTADL